jgi:hypothetical protein
MAFPRRMAFLVAATASTLLLLLVAGLTAWASSLAVEGGWPAPTELSQSGDTTSQGPTLLLEDDGTLHAIWTQQAAISDTLYYTVYPATSIDGGGNWSHTTPLTPSTSDRFEATADMDDYGGLHLVWRESPGQHQVWYAEFRNSSWKTRAMITATESVTNICGPDVEVAGDLLHAIWSEETLGPGGSNPYDVFYSRSDSGEVWSTPAPAAATGRTSLQLRLAGDQHNDLHVVWWEDTDPRKILYISGTVGAEETVWSAPITISEGLTQSAATPCITVGSDDVVHVAFGVDVENQQHVQDVYYAHFPISDTDSISATLIPGSRVDISQLLPTYASPALALFDTDDVHLAWNGMKTGDYSDRIYYSTSQDGGTTWSDPAPATPRDSFPDGFASLAADGEFVYLLYQEKVSGDDQDIYYTKRFPVRITFPLALKVY